MQVEDVVRTEIALLASAPNEEPRNQNPNGSFNQSGGITDELVPYVSPLEGNSMKDHAGRAKLARKGKKKKESALKKCAKRLAESAIENYSHSAMKTECSSQKQEHDVSNSLKNGTKRSKKKMHFGIDADKETLENVLATPYDNFGPETATFPEVKKISQFPEKNGRASKKTDFGIDANTVNRENVLADPVSLGAPDGGSKNFRTEALALPEVKKVGHFPENSRTKGRARKK